MTKFKKGDRIAFVKDDNYSSGKMPKGTLATYDDDSPTAGVPWVRLDTGERVITWRDRIAHAEDHGTGDGSASDICAEPGCNCDLERRFPAPLDPSGRHELAADFFHAKTGTAASYFTVDLSPEERAPYYAAADAFLATQPAPEPEPEWKPGTVARLSLVDDDLAPRAYRTGIGTWRAIDDSRSWTDADVEYVHEMVVIDPAEAWRNLDAHLAGRGDLTQAEADLLGNVFPEVDLGLA